MTHFVNCIYIYVNSKGEIRLNYFSEMFNTVSTAVVRHKQNMLYLAPAVALTISLYTLFVMLGSDILISFSFSNRNLLSEIDISDAIDFDKFSIHYEKLFYEEADHQNNRYYVKNVGGKDIKAWVFMSMSSMERLSIKYYIFENVYACAAGGWTVDNIEIRYPQKVVVPRFCTRKGVVMGRYQDVIVLGNDWCYVFAHFVYDVLSYLIFIPEDVRKIATFLILSSSSIYHEMVTHFGVPSDNIICTNHQFVYATRMHTVIANESIHGAMIRGLPEVSRILRSKLKCENIESKYLGLYNRHPRTNRHILEFDKFDEKCREHFKGIIPVLRIHDYNNLKSAVTTYASVKILVGPTGSGLTNMIYMRSKTGVVCCLGDLNDPPAESCAEALQIWMITLHIPGMGHHSGKKGPMPIEIGIKAIKNVMYAVQHQKWENDALEY